MSIFEKFAERADLMGSMMNRTATRVPEFMSPGVENELVRAITRCRGCRNTMDCRDFLAGGDASSIADVPTFCPNAGLFAKWRTARALE